MNRRVVRAVGLAVLGLVLLTGFVLLMVRSGPLAPVRVTTAVLERGAFENAVFGIGTVEAERAYAIGPTSPGRILAVHVDVGSEVRAGQLLAEMDPVELDARLAASRAASARAVHALASAGAQVRDAEVRQELAARNARRYASLGERAFFSDAAVEAKRQEADSAGAQLQAARAQLDAARMDLQRLDAERVAVERQRANVRLAAPVAGVVTARDAEPGTTLVAGQSVLRMVDLASVRVRTRIDQGRSGGVRAGQAASIVLRSRPGFAVAGKVSRVELNGDAVTEERIVQVVFDELPKDFAFGELAEVTIATSRGADVLAVPGAAVHEQDGRRGVWTVADGATAFVPVRTGEASLDGRTVVLEGLQAGDRIIVHSERELRAGERVAVVESLEGMRR
ncbi:efflux RND transporter periplasmic adaptor subunit [Aromatoleum toluvorans]|uniref:Efflux RND transporter periplasmic adaptor subunit n=1 Tax=Aromatoleum toluvorans TaxID=92002 RepID=A0ABX1Q2K3_9RHOO|nr:efflux RND transporter periplasmic adaptor subunit [Aromatoleum toluvorans]NMG45593.1 efflux RND transporter periplasmic adaptor subunit [Aromatoleum toluvorans]